MHTPVWGYLLAFLVETRRYFYMLRCKLKKKQAFLYAAIFAIAVQGAVDELTSGINE